MTATGNAAGARPLPECSADGRFELFKTTKKYDGDVGREQHGFPPARNCRRSERGPAPLSFIEVR